MSRAGKKKSGSVRARSDDKERGEEAQSKKKFEKQFLVADVVGVIAGFMERKTEVLRNLMLVCHTWREGVIFQNGCKPISGVGWDYEALRLRQTKKLQIDNSKLADANFFDLFDHAPDLISVESLNFYCSKIGTAGFAALRLLSCKMKMFPNLKHLDLRGMDPPDMDSVLECVSGIATLETLLLGQSPFTDAGVVHLKNLSLTRLHLMFQDITDVSLKAIGCITSLRELDLGYDTAMSDDGIAFLQPLQNLEVLYLTRCGQLTDTALRHVAELHNLRTLNLSACDGFTKAGYERLPALSNLTDLNVSLNDIDDDGLEAICEVKSLKILNLSFCRGLVAGVFTKLCRLPALQHLNVVGCSELVKDDIVNILPHQGLRSLEIDGSQSIWLGVLRSHPTLTHLKVWNPGDIEFALLSHMPHISWLRIEQFKNSTEFQMNCLLQMPSLKVVNADSFSEKHARQLAAKGIEISHSGGHTWDVDGEV